MGSACEGRAEQAASRAVRWAATCRKLQLEALQIARTMIDSQARRHMVFISAGYRLAGGSKDQPLPGLHINDRQMRLYMRSRHADTPAIAAARAGSALQPPIGLTPIRGYRLSHGAAAAPIRWLAFGTARSCQC